MEGNPLYYLLLLEASATEVVAEVTDTCIWWRLDVDTLLLVLPGGSDVPI